MKKYILYKSFSKKKIKDNNNSNLLYIILNIFHSLNFKTKVIVFFLGFFSIFLYAQAQTAALSPLGLAAVPILSLIGEPTHPIAADFSNSLAIVQVVKYCITYIVNIQVQSIEFISSTPMGGTGMFNHITNGLTVFAAVACFYKLIVHFNNTERFDNAKAFTGFFNYVGIFILFIFSSQIVNHVAGLNQGINTSNISNVANVILTEVDSKIINDWTVMKEEYDALEAQIEENNGVMSDVTNLKYVFLQKWNVTKFNFQSTIYYLYMTFFSLILMSALAIPTVVITIMVKVTLSIMVVGAKLVFLLAFIPGFENTWKTYMLNLLNVLLWVPIFNIIFSFILALVSATISNGSIGTGQIIWLSIITIIFAFKSVSLTTSTANSIISGSGAGIAGALGGMAAFGGATMVAGAAAVGAGVAVTAATGSAGAGAGTTSAASKFSQQ